MNTTFFSSMFLSRFYCVMFGICLLVFGSFTGNSLARTWTIQTVDDPKNFSDLYPRAIAIDSGDHPHIAYGGDHLYYAYHDGTDWKFETADSSSGVGRYASIALDSSGNVHISYYDAVNADLKYATNASGSWITSAVDSGGGDVGTYASIALDSSDKAHISYYDATNADLKYATNASGSWVSSTVDNGGGDVGTYASIALDSSDKVHISYYDATNADLKYATNASGSWITAAVDSGGNVGSYTSIALGLSDNAHISYYDGTNADLKYATNASGSWVSETVDSDGNVGSYTSIALDSSNNAHISYHDATTSNGLLKHANNASGSWATSTVDALGYVGSYTSIALDSSNNAHITYYYYDYTTNHDLKYATNVSGSWAKEAVDTSISIGDRTSVALDTSEKVHISYFGCGDVIGHLKYATNASGSWVTETLDTSWNRDATSIALGLLDKVHISYGNMYGSHDTKYITNASGPWVDRVVAIGNYKANSIAIDSSGKVHISNFGCGNNCLQYSTNSSGSWATQQIDATNQNGGCAIAVDSSDNVHIAYVSANNYELRYATNASGSWVTETIGSAGWWASLSLDSLGKAHISHYGDGGVGYSTWLQYTTNASGSWVTDTLDNNDGAGGSNSIAVDSSDKVHISYNGHDGSVKYVTNASDLWVTETVNTKGNNTSIAVDSSGKVHISYNEGINYSLKYATFLMATISGTPTSPTNLTSATLTVGGTGIVSYKYKLDDGSYSVETPVGTQISLSELTESTHTVLVIGKDSDGNWQAEADATTATWSVDITPPTATISGTPPSPTDSTDAVLTVGGTDVVSYKYKLDAAIYSAETAVGAQISLSSLVEGSHTVSVIGKDSSRNWQLEADVTTTIWTVDITAPSGPIVIDSGTTYCNSRNVTITLNSSDAAYMCFSNDDTSYADWEVYAASKSWALSEYDGTKYVYVKYRDTVGNVSTAVSDTIILDTTAPSGSLTIKDGATHCNNLNISLSLNSSDAAYICFSNDNISYSAWENYAASESWTLSEGDGTKYVYVKYKDAVGNIATVSDSIILDSAGPSGPIVIDSGATYCTSRDITITLNSSDADYMCFSNDNTSFSNWEDYAASRSWTLPEGDGTKYVYVKYKDEAGNIGTASSSIILDTIAPDLPVLINIEDTTENEPTFDWENVSGASYYIVQYADNPDFSSPITVESIAPSDYTAASALDDGTWYWRVCAVDAAGNASEWSSTGLFTVDTADYCESIPEKPVLLSPADEATNVSRTPTLTTSAFADPENCSTHWKTRWQISEHEDFHGLTLNANTFDNLTTFEVAKTMLKPNTIYYWRVKYWGSHGNKSEWSDIYSFTTEAVVDDTNDNGIPDDQEVDNSVDLDGDGTHDNDQVDEIKSIKEKKGNTNIGVRPQDGQITAAEWLDDDAVSSHGNKPKDVPYGLISFRLEVPNYGDTATVKIYLSKAAHKDARWMKYDAVDGWQDYSDHAQFNEDRDQVTLTLKDGGYGDNDHTENGVIIDPSGLGIPDSSSTSGSSSGSSSSGDCFIATAAYGSVMQPHVKILREFRDRFLLNNSMGKAFMCLYYTYSPPLADFIAQNANLRVITRLSLLPIVGMSWVAIKLGLFSTLAMTFFLISGIMYFLIFRKKLTKQIN